MKFSCYPNYSISYIFFIKSIKENIRSNPDNFERKDSFILYFEKKSWFDKRIVKHLEKKLLLIKKIDITTFFTN